MSLEIVFVDKQQEQLVTNYLIRNKQTATEALRYNGLDGIARQEAQYRFDRLYTAGTLPDAFLTSEG